MIVKPESVKLVKPQFGCLIDNAIVAMWWLAKLSVPAIWFSVGSVDVINVIPRAGWLDKI